MESVAESGAQSGKIVLDLKGVSKAWDGRGAVVSNLDLRIVRGDRLGIVGPNGAGKTTLISMLTGDLGPDSGTVKRGTNLTMAYLDQTRATLDGTATLWDTLTPAGGDQVMVRGKPRHVAAYAQDFLFTTAQLRQPVASLSGGERNRLLLSLALANPANLLILDEPTNDLDAETLDLLEQTLADYDGSVIVVSHDRAFLDGVVTATLAPLGDGRWIETPGGWSDLERQGLPTLRRAAPTKAMPPPPPPPPPISKAKLSYKDERRLSELEKAMPALEADIAAQEERLADPTLYARDPKAFDALMATLAKARAMLAAQEEEWLGLEEKKAALGSGS
jgi:ABC transport system ATP-binding/permease protein